MFEFSRCCLQCGRFALACSFCGAQTVCLTVACECLGRLCVLCVVKLRRSRVCTVCAICLSAQRSSSALYVLCRAMLESGRSFYWVSVSLHMLWGCYESKYHFYFLRVHVYRVPPVLSSTFSVFVVRVYLSIVAVSVPRLRTCASAAACASNHNGLRGVGCASPASLVVERVLVCFLIKRAGRSEWHLFFGVSERHRRAGLVLSGLL